MLIFQRLPSARSFVRSFVYLFSLCLSLSISLVLSSRELDRPEALQLRVFQLFAITRRIIHLLFLPLT